MIDRRSRSCKEAFIGQFSTDADLWLTRVKRMGKRIDSWPAGPVSQKCRVLHFVPYFATGGVELASIAGAESGEGRIRTHFLAAPGNDVPPTRTEWVTHGPTANPLGISATGYAVWEVRRFDPDVIVFSLWRSIFAFLAVKLMYPTKKIVTFLHCSRRVHLIDRLTTKFMTALSDEVWADSGSSLRSQISRRKPSRVISMLIDNSRRPPKESAPTPTFVSWCRLNVPKRVDRALELIAWLKEARSDVRYIVIGPDDGALESLRQLSHRLHLIKEVAFAGRRDRHFIRQAAEPATFYVQLSEYEGQAMAVVEAMQLGLIPVVTAVGGIPTYCIDGLNSIIFTGTEETARRILALLDDPSALVRLSAEAQKTFNGAPSYAESVLAAAEAQWPSLEGKGSPAR